VYEISIYFITFHVWRWEIRCDGTLRRCGTRPTPGRSRKGTDSIRQRLPVATTQIGAES
jgi:hypothetical protein